MNMLKRLLKIIMFVFAVLMLMIGSVQAQSSLIAPGDVLIYLRSSGHGGEYIRLSSTFRQIYDLPQDKCSLKSPDGTYVAQSPLPGDMSDLIIRRMDTHEILIQTPWQADWDACYINWSNDTVLTIRQQGTRQDFFYFDVSSGSLVSVSNPYSPPEYPPLPDWFPQSDQNFILPSPQNTIFLYERCPTGQINDAGHCAGVTQFVIYDAAQQRVIHVLQHPDSSIVSGYDPFNPLQHVVSYPSVGWSSTGRYLAFQRYQKTPYDYFTLMIYDMASNQDVNMDLVNAPIDYYRAIQWSPEGNKLALWTIGRFGENQPTDNWDILRTPVVIDVQTGQYITADQPYDMDAQGGGKDFTWSPDGQAVVFVAGNGDLIYMDVDTGKTTVLDKQVHEIIIWKHET